MRRKRPRSRRVAAGGGWHVRARVERFIEPALLLLLRECPRHGYELLELVPELAGVDGPVDAGNMYRLLRGLEEDGAVRSEWNAELPGPAKRTYELTGEGQDLLDRWAEALRATEQTIDAFRKRYEEERG